MQSNAPVQPDPTKYQRENCWRITDEGKKQAVASIMTTTTTPNPAIVTRKFPMPFFPSQDAIGFINQNTGDCILFHADSGKLWTAITFDTAQQIKLIVDNPDYRLNLPNSEF